MRVSDLAAQLGCPFDGDGDHTVSRVAALTDGSSDALGFVRSEKRLAELEASAIGAVIAGLVTASISRSATPAKVLAGIVLVLGLAEAAAYQFGDATAEEAEQAASGQEREGVDRSRHL